MAREIWNQNDAFPPDQAVATNFEIMPIWLLIILVLAFLATFLLPKNRDKKWILFVWLPLVVVAIIGTLYFLYAVLSLGTIPSGPDGGFYGLGLVLVALGCFPFLLLLFFCIRFRPKLSSKNKLK